LLELFENILGTYFGFSAITALFIATLAGVTSKYIKSYYDRIIGDLDKKGDHSYYINLILRDRPEYFKRLLEFYLAICERVFGGTREIPISWSGLGVHFVFSFAYSSIVFLLFWLAYGSESVFGFIISNPTRFSERVIYVVIFLTALLAMSGFYFLIQKIQNKPRLKLSLNVLIRLFIVVSLIPIFRNFSGLLIAGIAGLAAISENYRRGFRLSLGGIIALVVSIGIALVFGVLNSDFGPTISILLFCVLIPLRNPDVSGH